MTITEFLLARIAETQARAEEAKTHDLGDPGAALWQDVNPARVLAECEAKRRIVEFHQNWPVLVEGPTTFEHRPDPGASVDTFAMQASRQLAWLTEQEYRKRFGDEPPTAQMLKALASVYADHPDYDPAWRA